MDTLVEKSRSGTKEESRIRKDRRSPKGAEQEAAEVLGKLGHRKLKGRAPLLTLPATTYLHTPDSARKRSLGVEERTDRENETEK